jgi:hypothetical protein
MNRLAKLLIGCAATASFGSAAQAGQINVGDFTSPTTVGFGNPGSTAFVGEPLVIGPASFTDQDSSSLIWWAAGNGYNDCIGGCVTTGSYGAGALEVALSSGYEMVGLYVGQATPYSLSVNFYDASNVLLGTVLASGASDGVTFAGWQSVGNPIASVRIVNPTENDFVIAAQSGLFQLVAGVPEPGTWAMMLLGFGAIGVAMRRQKKATQAALAA